MSYSPLQLAEAYLQAGEIDDALDALNQHIATMPDDESRRLRAAILSRHTDDASWRNALDDLDALEVPTPDDAILRSTLHSKLGDDDTAISVMLAAHQHFPTQERITERCLYLLRAGGKLDEARALVAGVPENWRWSQWAGDLAHDAGDLPEAIRHYSAAIDALDSRYALDTNQRANVLQNEQVSDAAALTIVAVYARLRAARADVYERQNEDALADADYAVAQTLIPDDTLIQLSRAFLSAKRGDLEPAKAGCEAALKHAPDALRRTYLLPLIHTAPYEDLHALANKYA